MLNKLFFDMIWDKEFAEKSRTIRDSYPYQIIKEEDQNIIVINAVGMPEKDITVKTVEEQDKTFLQIEGKSFNEVVKEDYSFKNRFLINPAKIKNIEYKAENGLLYVYVSFKEKPAIEIPIKRCR